MKYRTVQHIVRGEEVALGRSAVRQSLPTEQVPQVSPFLLLHHFGPFEVEPGVDPLDVSPHPHRGFEPVTFLYQGGIRHKDSRGNEGILEAGDVQWMTAGRGVIHSERASRAFLREGGRLEGVQLWVNLPKVHKMAPPRYQHFRSTDLPTYMEAGVRVRMVAGQWGDLTGPVQTYSPLLACQVSLQDSQGIGIDLPSDYNALIYVVNGTVTLNRNFSYQDATLLQLRNDGQGIHLQGDPAGEVLVLAGALIDEPLAQWGPYVMNTQTEIMEAMRDYQMGKMGFYID